MTKHESWNEVFATHMLRRWNESVHVTVRADELFTDTPDKLKEFLHLQQEFSRMFDHLQSQGVNRKSNRWRALGLEWWYRLSHDRKTMGERVRALQSRSLRTISVWSFPRTWDLLQFALPKAIRAQNYEPVRQELLEDYYIARARYTSRAARFYLGCCFTVRTIVAVFQSLTAWITSLGLERISRLVPEPLRQWWFGMH